jgi:transcription factor Sp
MSGESNGLSSRDEFVDNQDSSQSQQTCHQSQHQQSQQPSPLALLAATCSKIGSPSESGESGGQSNTATTVKLVGQNQVIQASDFAQLIPVQAGQTLGVLNPDGTVTQLNPQVVTTAVSVANSVTPIKAITSVANQNANALSQAQATQLLQSATNAANIYSIIQPQQLQIDGQEAIFIPGGQQAIHISGNQLLSSPNQTVVRSQNATQNTQSTQQTVFIPGIGNVSLGQFTSGQTVAVRQGNVVQTLQLPVQQTIPVQAISTQNGQTILQTIHLPIQALQSLNAGNIQHLTAQVLPQMQQVLYNHQVNSYNK